MSRWCADASLADLVEISEACQMAESLGAGVDCWASLDAVLQQCLDDAAAAGHLKGPLGSGLKLDLLKRNRNKFLGKRDGGAISNFLSKRQEGVDQLHDRLNAILRNRFEAENNEKRNRNRFLGKRTEHDGDFELVDLMSTEKKSRNKFLGKRDQMERSGPAMDDKRSRNRFLGKKDQTNIKRSRNKFLGKRAVQDE